MYPLYPAIKSYQSHELAVDAPHVLYLDEAGNPNGLPVLVLHGGPGAGGDAHLRRFFNPEIFRIINFDQRGCGRSIPQAEILNNTTADLLRDIESIREYLDLERFFLFGGGWGSLLALLYAESYPQYISGLLLHQIFLGRKADIDWFYQSGANLVYPDYWQEFCNFVPLAEQEHLCRYYANCLQGNNELARMAAAKNWVLWKAHASTLQPNSNLIDEYLDPHFARGLATIESHYINHHFFIKENEVLENIHKIQHIPAFLVHGRYDMVCPLHAAWELQQALPSSQLSIVRDAGHSYHETGLIDAIITATIQLSREGLSAG
jgi:proline iminopeptidase